MGRGMLGTVLNFRKLTREQRGGVINLLSLSALSCFSDAGAAFLPRRLLCSGFANRGSRRATAGRYPSSSHLLLLLRGRHPLENRGCTPFLRGGHQAKFLPCPPGQPTGQELLSATAASPGTGRPLHQPLPLTDGTPDETPRPR